MRSLNTEDRIALVLGATLILGAVARFAPGLFTGFPLNDGGMFYSMILDLRESAYSLPRTTSYNFLDIPYAYPPFGFYLVRLLSDIFQISEIELLRWIPPAVNLASVLVLYLLASEFLGSHLRGVVAASIYALTPGSFSWFIMGGGLTRALGSLFLLLSVWSVYRLFRYDNQWFLLFSTLFCALTVVSHPEAGIHAAALCAMLWLFYGRTRQSSFYAIIAAMGTLLLSSPWWLTVIMNHGLEPFVSVFHSGLYGTPIIKAIVLNILARQGFVPVLLILRLAGIAWSIWKRQSYFLLAWTALPFIVEPRSAASVAFYPHCMLAAIGLVNAIPALFRRFTLQKGLVRDDKEKNHIRWVDLALFTLLFYLFVESYLYGFRQINTSLTGADRAVMSWVRQNTPDGSRFLLLTGGHGPETDAFQEWFPALSVRQSLTTIQGLEWLLGPRFFIYYRELRELQTCDTVDCLKVWITENELEFEYLLVLSSDYHENLSYTLKRDRNYIKIYQTDTCQIFRYLP